MIDAENKAPVDDAVAYLSDLEPVERSEERDAYDVRVCERFDGPFDHDAPANIRGAALVYLYTNYKPDSDEIEGQELDIYDDEADVD